MRTTASLLAAALLVAACSSTTTAFDWDQSYDFSTLETWSWADAKPRSAPDDLVTQRIDATIEAQLAAQGYRRVESAADFRVAWSISRKDRVRVQEWGGYRDPHRAYWSGASRTTSVQVEHYEEGTLVVDVIDPVENRMVWRGNATKVLKRSPSPEAIDANVRAVVAKLLGGFPPK